MKKQKKKQLSDTPKIVISAIIFFRAIQVLFAMKFTGNYYAIGMFPKLL